MPRLGPLSINLDLTSACNLACPFCVDSEIINTGDFIRTGNVKESIDTLVDYGLRSVIIIGGGEPALHRDFEELTAYFKEKGLQVGIVTNGSRLDKVVSIAPLLSAGDWVRISLDSATQKTYEEAHLPKVKIDFQEILNKAERIKQLNPSVSLGFSFVIFWDSITFNGYSMPSNVSQMTPAARLAKEHRFDYISFKPCLVRLDGSKKESFMHGVDRDARDNIRGEIAGQLEEAKKLNDDTFRILESVNLKALIMDQVEQLKTQPGVCHMQFFRSVLTSGGIFHCPAFRGVEKARIGDVTGYQNEREIQETFKTLEKSIDCFNATEECREVGCFYHHANCWIDELIRNSGDVETIEPVEDIDCFL